MSAYASLKTEFTDQECLLAALADNTERCYKTVEVHETPVNLVGYHSDTRSQVANIVIRRNEIGSASNDIGFVKDNDGKFTAIISDYDSHRHGTKWMTAVKASYTEKRFEKEAKRQGLRFVSREKLNGKTIVKYLKQGN
jgi:predicted transposase YbfD/YdcC